MTEPDTKIRSLMDDLAREARLDPRLERPTPAPAPTAPAVSPAPARSPSSGPGTEPSASTSPEPSASPEPSTAFATDVADGRYIAYVHEVDAGADPATVLFDRAEFLTGDAANRYARDHGLETPVPNDNLIVNDNPLLRLMPLAPDVEIDVIDYSRCSSACERLDAGAFADLLTMSKPFADGVHMGPAAPYWLTIRGGTVVKIEEQFQV